jgi:hypothetical protein
MRVKQTSKVLCIALNDKDAPLIHNMDDLERVNPGTLSKLLDWSEALQDLGW